MILRDLGWCKFFVTDSSFGHVGVGDATLLQRIDVGTDKVCWQEQVHGDRCVVMTEPMVNADTDTMVTQVADLMLVVRTADCGPVVMMDPIKKIVSAVHAGRKGIVAGVVEVTIERFRELGSVMSDVHVFIGPHIRVESYEIGDDVVREVTEAGRGDLVVTRGSRKYFDVTGGIMKALTKGGVSESKIKDCGIDTFKERDYFSYRRHQLETGQSEGYSTFATGAVICG